MNDAQRDAIVAKLAPDVNALDSDAWRSMAPSGTGAPVRPGTSMPGKRQPAGTTTPAAEPLITAEDAMRMIQDPSQQSTIIVAMNGCHGCEMLRKTLRDALVAGHVTTDDRLGVLERQEWMKIMAMLPTTEVPALFKVGKGAVNKGPIGNQDAAVLVAFIKYQA